MCCWGALNIGVWLKCHWTRHWMIEPEPNWWYKKPWNFRIEDCCHWWCLKILEGYLVFLLFSHTWITQLNYFLYVDHFLQLDLHKRLKNRLLIYAIKWPRHVVLIPPAPDLQRTDWFGSQVCGQEVHFTWIEVWNGFYCHFVFFIFFCSFCSVHC